MDPNVNKDKKTLKSVLHKIKIYMYVIMPFTVRKNKLRAFRRKWRKKRPARKKVDRTQNRKISKLFKMVKFGKEQKFIDQINLGFTVDNTWAGIQSRDLTFILQGEDAHQRVGNKVKILQHRIKILVTLGDTTNIYRIMAVRFPNKAASLVTLSDALEDTAAVTPLNLMSMYKRQGNTKYQILWDTGVKKLTELHPQHSYDLVLNNNGKGYYAGYDSPSANACVAGFTYLVAVTDSAIAPNPSFTTMSRTIYTG